MKANRIQRLRSFVRKADRLVDGTVYESKVSNYEALPPYSAVIECKDIKKWWRPFNVLLFDTPNVNHEVGLHICYYELGKEVDPRRVEGLEHHRDMMVKYLIEQLDISRDEIDVETILDHHVRLTVAVKDTEDAEKKLHAVALTARNFLSRKTWQEDLVPPLREQVANA